MNYIFIVIVLYLFIYNPIFSFLGGLGSVKLLYPFLLLLFFTEKNTLKVLRLFRKERNYFVLFIIFSLMRFCMGGDVVELYRHLILFIENFLVPIVLIFACHKYIKYNEQSFVKLILITGSVAAVISTLCFINPQIQEIVKMRLQTWGAGGYLSAIDFRGFGLGESLTYSYGMIQGLILGIGIINIKNNRWFVFLIPLFLLSILFNARTGIFIAVISVMVYLLTSPGFKSWFYVLLGGTIAYLLIIISLQRYGIGDDQLFFYNDFVKQMTEVEEYGVEGNTGTVGYLASEHVVWPTNITEWILGRGYILYGIKGAQNTDSGFFQQLNYGGLIYIAMMFSFILFLLKRMLSLKIPKDFILLFIAAMMIAHFKGNLIMNTGTFRLMMFLYYSYVICKKYLKTKGGIII